MTIYTDKNNTFSSFPSPDHDRLPVPAKASQLRSSTDEESCNDEFITGSPGSLRVSDDGSSLPVITMGGSTQHPAVPASSITALPDSQHLYPSLPVSSLVNDAKKEAASSTSDSVAMAEEKDQPKSIESFKQFQIVAAELNITPRQLTLAHLDPQQSKSEFGELRYISNYIFTQENGYDTKVINEMLKESPSLIKAHNRWSDVRPWGHNIVSLKQPILDESEGGYPVSYVNASHMKLDDEHFISCSAPQPAAFDHFWQMVFEQGSDTMVMLTKCVEKRVIKAHAYWHPDVGETVKFNNVSVTLNSFQTRTPDGKTGVDIKDASIIKRTFTIASEGESRTVTHYQYREWPDMGRPESTSEFIYLMNEVEACQPKGPIITHCSAGIGRAGTFIIAYAQCKKILSELRKAGLPVDFIRDNYNINIAAQVLAARAQRPGMVQQPEQYHFIKEVIATSVEEELKRLLREEQTNTPPEAK